MRKSNTGPTLKRRFILWLWFLFPFILMAISSLNQFTSTAQELAVLETGLHTATSIRDAPPGKPAFVVGRIDPQTPTVATEDGLALYRVSRYQRDQRWHPAEVHRPAFTVLTADGSVRIVNQDYPLYGGPVRLDGEVRDGASIRVFGFRPDDPVFVVGTTAEGGIAAQQVLSGTPEVRARTLADAHGVAVRLLVVSGLCMLAISIGVVLAYVHGASRRRPLLVA
jgi:hypothetical protein